MHEALVQILNWDNLAAFLNSNFTSALSGALAGAFAGAMAAQKIADRANQRDALLSEIRSTNAAIMVAFTICNAGMSLKRQLVKDIHDRYVTSKKELEVFKQRRALGQEPGSFAFQADLRTVQMPVVPIDVLRTQMYEKVSATGRPLALTAAIAGSVAALAEVLQRRVELVDRFRGLGESHPNLAPLYFAQPYGGGHVSEEFADTVDAMYRMTDDMIFFSQLLVTDLHVHGGRILTQYRKIAKIKEEKISSVDFTAAREEGLIPDPAQYADWLKGFPNAAQQSLSA